METANPTLTQEYFTPQQAAARIGVSVEFIYDACAAKGLKHVRLGGKRSIRLKPEWLDDWMLQTAVVNL
jgi:excisionase family DNA binding protein